MTCRTAEEVKKAHIAKMGEPLGAQYDALWQEVAWLHHKWHQYVELYGTKPTRVELLNRSAATFFRITQDALWDDTLLHLARLTDKPSSGRARDNLTVQSLPKLVSDPKARTTVEGAVMAALAATEFCRDHRNRRIAHRDLALAMNAAASPLKLASRKQVNDALDTIVDVLNAVQGHYMDSETHFRLGHSIAGAEELLYLLHDGLRAQAEQKERLRCGELTWEDFPKNL